MSAEKQQQHVAEGKTVVTDPSQKYLHYMWHTKKKEWMNEERKMDLNELKSNQASLWSQPLSWWAATSYLQLRKLLNVDSAPTLLCHLIQRVYQDGSASTVTAVTGEDVNVSLMRITVHILSAGPPPKIKGKSRFNLSLTYFHTSLLLFLASFYNTCTMLFNVSCWF